MRVPADYFQKIVLRKKKVVDPDAGLQNEVKLWR